MNEQSKLSPDERAFMDAAKKGDVDQVCELLAKGIPVDLREDFDMPWNQTALMYAARHGHLEVVRALLKAGASVSAADKNARDSEGENQPLHHAMAGKNLAVMEELLAAGADPNALTTSGNTPLNHAIRHNHTDAAKLLLLRGANINLKPGRKRFRPPLCAAGRAEIPPTAIRDFMHLLLEAGADPNATDNLDQTALFPLATARDIPNDIAIPLMEALLKAGAKPDHLEKDGDTPLLLAVLYENPPAVKLLAQAGADVNRVYERGTVLDINERDITRSQKRLDDPSFTGPNRQFEERSMQRYHAVAKILREFGAKRKIELQ